MVNEQGASAPASKASAHVVPQGYTVSAGDRALIKHQRPVAIWLTGLPGSGKSTLADAVERRLHARGLHTTVLDGDNMRTGLNRDLGFTADGRRENVRRVGEVARLMLDAGIIPIVALVSPFQADRDGARDLFEPGDFIEVFVDSPPEVCIARDPKGLYRKAAAGQLANMTGVGQNYEVPKNPELHVHGDGDLQQNTEQVVQAVLTAQRR